MLWLVYDLVKLFCGLMLNNNLVVRGTPNLTELCYFLAYKECFIYSSIGVYGVVCL